MKAYLDIETSYGGEITVVGVLLETGNFTQLIGNEITSYFLLQILKGVSTIYTYNGSRFDLPVIKKNIGLDLTKYFGSYDLMFDCWRLNLYGGLKNVEKKLNIPRKLKGITGYEAMKLWHLYQNYGDTHALALLLAYNREDVENLVVLEKRLFGNCSAIDYSGY
ncbi:MAG: ribonuclease H-like domain-containing protein [bacterium]